MRGDEERVVAAVCAWLRSHGWHVQTEVDHVDVLATKGGRSLYAEAKGSSSVIGTDIDTMYGQLLRRMRNSDDDTARFAAVVMDEPKSLRAVRRVPAHIRELLNIDIYTVSIDGHVTLQD